MSTTQESKDDLTTKEGVSTISFMPSESHITKDTSSVSVEGSTVTSTIPSSEPYSHKSIMQTTSFTSHVSEVYTVPFHIHKLHS